MNPNDFPVFSSTLFCSYPSQGQVFICQSETDLHLQNELSPHSGFPEDEPNVFYDPLTVAQL